MTGLAQATATYTGLVGLVCVAHALLGRRRPRLLDAALVMSGVAVVAVVVADLVGLAGRPHPAELATHLGYAGTAPVILPATAGLTRGDAGRWASACFATACAVTVVVLARLVSTRHG